MTTTHPPDSFDAVILGTGQAGKPLATALARAGHRTAIVERDRVGGSCINFGCTPTKTMVASARVAELARRGREYGVETGPVSVDLERVRERTRSVVDSFRKGVLRGLERTDGIDLVRGHGRLAGRHDGRHAVEVELDAGGTRSLRAPWVFLNTGTRTAVPPVDGLDSVPWLDSAGIIELGEVPDRLLVLGGGYIGVEFGQMFRRFGSEVTVIQRDPQLLTREDRDVADGLREILEDDGVEVLLESEARRAGPSSSGGGGIRLEVETRSGKTRELTGSHLLLAAGRRPNTDDLGLEAAGVATDARGFVEANDRLETNVEGVWALGDVKGGPAFTHLSYDDFRVVRQNLLEGGSASTRDRPVPYTVFTDPQLGRVGLSEEEARERAREEDLDPRVARIPMKHVARALETGETRGLMKAVVDGGSGRILGCAILGIEGGEVMSVVQTAMMGGLPYTALRDGVFAHPTLAESLNNLFATLDRRPEGS